MIIDDEPLAPPELPITAPPQLTGFARRVDNIRATAKRAAMRLLEARDPLLPEPSNEEEMMQLVDMMAATPKKWGVTLLPHEKRAIVQWHNLRRLTNMAQAAKEEPDASPNR